MTAKEEKSINIVFEDENIIVINKHSNLLSHNNNYHETADSVVSLLQEENKNLYNAEDPLRNGIVHRLDKDTTGLMVLAKNKFSYKSLIEQFKKREVLKEYIAYCWGTPMLLAGKIDKPISNYLNRKKARTNEIGKEAITQYKVINNFNNYFSEIECRILTGRTHQIRVHMQSVKCPLIGDQLYSRDRNMPEKLSHKLKKRILGFRRQALHSKKLSFEDPLTNKIKYFLAEQPEDMLELKNVLVDEFN